MARPLAAFLTRFSEEPELAEASTPVMDPPLAVDPAVLRHQDELRELRAALEATSRRDIDELATSHAAAAASALAKARSLWCEAEAAKIAEKIETAFVALRSEIDTRIAEALTPMLASALYQRARAATLEHLDLWLGDPAHPALALRGPGDLVDAIRAALPGATIDYVPHDDIDVIVTAEGARLETRLGAALAAVAGHEV